MSGEPVRCPRCGAPRSAVGEVCPACLFRAGAGDETIAASDLTMSEVPDQATRLSTPGTAAGSASTSSAGSVGPTGPTGLPLAIGPYRIVSLLGEGGMGVVYLAEQTEPIRRTVALKVIKLGMDTRDVVARFESERQALALMDHPNIARVIDAGATPDGRPFFVMEHVAGVPITEYCDAHRLSTRARLALLAQVCGAVQHAHQKGVIHRDLKPSNVLVGEQDGTPVPKIIDFGIAKATDQRLTERTMFTEQGQFIGTPEYMSPEQTLGVLDIDATTDIYALGVILYELLAGSLPFEATTLRRAGYAEMQRIIREDEPPKPSTKVSAQGATASDMAGRRQTDAGSLRKLLAGDLDWITLKALEKDRARRYASASEFAADITRYLNDEPVLASPPSAAYRARKFVRRHRGGVVAAGLAVTALIVGLALSTTFFLRARAAQAIASEQSYMANLAAADLLLRSNQPDEARKRLDAAPAGLREWEWDYLYATSDSSVATIGSQAGAVTSVSFTPDGSRILAISDHGVLQAIDAITHLPVASFRYPASGSADVESVVAVSREGARTVSIAWRMPVGAGVGRAKGKVQFHAADLTEAQSERVRGVTVRDVTSRTVAGRWILPSMGLSLLLDPPEGGIAFGDNEIRDPVTWRTVARMGGRRGAPVGAVFSADGARVAAWTWDNVLRVWDLKTGAVIATLSGHLDGIADVAFTRDGRRLVSACHDGKVRIWEIGSSAPARVLAAHDGGVSAIALSSDETTIASGGSDHMVRLWNFADGRLLGTYPGHEAEVTSVAFSPDGRLVASSSADRTVRLWLVALPGSEHLVRWVGHHGRANTVAFSPDGRQIVSGSSDNTIRIWSTDGVRPLPAFRNMNLFGAPSAPSDTLERIATSAPDGIRLWTLKPPFDLQTLGAQTGQAGRLLALSHDGQHVLVGARDHTLRVATDGHAAIRTLSGHTQDITAVAISADGSHAASASIDHSIRIWDLHAAGTLRTIALDGRVSHLVFSPDGRHLSGIVDDRVAMWDVNTGEWRLQYGMPDRAAGAIAFSSDGARLAAAFNDGQITVEVLDVAAPRVVATMRGAASDIRSVAFDRAGRRLVAASDDGTIRIWDAQSSHPLLAFQPGPKFLKVVAFSRDGDRLLAASDRVALLFDRRSAYVPDAVKWIEARRDDSVSDMLARLQSETDLDDRTRAAAIELTKRRGDVPDTLNMVSWRIVKSPGETEENYLRALASAETAVRLMPFERAYANTLAAAQYRVGRYQSALDTITQLMSVRETPSARDRVVSLLARLRLGQFDDVLADLTALLAISNPSDDLKALIAEAKALSDSLGRKGLKDKTN